MSKTIQIEVYKNEVLGRCTGTNHSVYIEILSEKMKKEGIKIIPSVQLLLKEWLKQQEAYGDYRLQKRMSALNTDIFIFELKKDRCPECLSTDCQYQWESMICNSCDHKWRIIR